MKLYAKEKPVTVPSIESDGYHCCRWCHWCENKGIDGFVCTNPIYAGDMTIVAAQVAEEGDLSDVLSEALHSVPEAQKTFMTELVSTLSKWGVSSKRVAEFKKVFEECLDQFLDMELKGEIDSQVSRLYQNAFKSYAPEGVHIKDPHTHYCREFW